ncbi:MAG TPA: FCD domain-containing protein [Propionicimonas sp.]|uniref:FadR/GntR family transcriptional regulator n=1 Tax=Propionicimonas sp. TaxID=1955623 RepID=UPI002F3FE828
MEEREGLHAYQVVLRHIETGILAGTFHAGDQLPPERDLAAQLGVGRSAVREAMRVLQTQGLITSSTGPGRGTRIAPAQGSALARIFQLHFALSDTGSGDLTETRVALERSSAALAAQRGTPTSLRHLDAIVEAMAAAETIDAFNRLDTEFHVLIARAGQNQLIADLTVAVRQSVREAIRDASDSLADWPRFRVQLLREHREILDAITAGDAAAAASLMEGHIRGAYSVLGISSRPAD